MPRPYSEDLRLRVVNAVEIVKTTCKISALFQVSPAFVSNLYRRWCQTGHVHSKQIGGYRRAFLEPYAAVLTEQLSMTLKDIQDWLECEQALTVSISCIDEFLRLKLGYRFKKNRGRP